MSQLVRPAITALLLTVVAAAPAWSNPATAHRNLGYPVAKPEKERSLACYMKTETGQLINLDVFCVTGAPEPVLGTGDVQATLRWETIDDLDLAVTDPSGQTVFFKNPNVPSGGQQDVDANADCIEPTPTPVENIFWPTGGAPGGNYKVEVRLYRRCVTRGPVPFDLTLLVQGKTQNLKGSVDNAKRTVSYPFTVKR
jgi:hypothetical protein